VLPHCSLVIGSGHPTTVLGALTHGLPLVLLSNGSGTEEAAEACQRAGVAITAPLADATPSVVAALLTRAFGDAALRRAAVAVGADLRSRGGLAAVAEIVAGANSSSIAASRAG
jgi:UDP:flavonoid glycosyltransferase YjiC (YdhE family)